MGKMQNIYEILEIMREDQRQFDRTVADLKRKKDSIKKRRTGALKKPSAIIGLAVITLLLTLSLITEALAIDVYHFLVQYKNGRVAEKVSTLSGENYKNCYEGYVANVVLLKKKKFSLQQFSQTFGPKIIID